MNVANLSGLECCTDLHYLYLYLNHISETSPIADLANLTARYLQTSQISDIGALVQNEGLGTVDLVNVQVNPLSPDSICVARLPDTEQVPNVYNSQFPSLRGPRSVQYQLKLRSAIS